MAGLVTLLNWYCGHLGGQGYHYTGRLTVEIGVERERKRQREGREGGGAISAMAMMSQRWASNQSIKIHCKT